METVMAILIGILVTIGTYLILSKHLLRVILGISLFSHAVNILIVTMGGLKTGAPALLSEKSSVFTDALPQALVLTAIVINFAVTAFLLVLGYKTYKRHGTDNLEELRGNDE